MNQHPIYLCTSTAGEYDSERALVDDIRMGHIALPTTVYLLEPCHPPTALWAFGNYHGLFFDVTKRIAQAFHDSVKWDATYSIREHSDVLEWLQGNGVVSMQLEAAE
jgi:hypothetical protein